MKWLLLAAVVIIPPALVAVSLARSGIDFDDWTNER